jgi:hypothetical protein
MVEVAFARVKGVKDVSRGARGAKVDVSLAAKRSGAGDRNRLGIERPCMT